MNIDQMPLTALIEKFLRKGFSFDEGYELLGPADEETALSILVRPLDGLYMGTDCHWLVNIGANAHFRVGAVWDAYVGDNWNVDVKGNHKENVDGWEVESVTLFKQSFVGGCLNETVVGFRFNEVGGWRVELVNDFKAEVVFGYKKEFVRKRKKVHVGENLIETVKGNHTETTHGDILVEAGAKGGEKLLLKCGGSSIELRHDGTITIQGKMINIHAENNIDGQAKEYLSLGGAKGFEFSSTEGAGQVMTQEKLMLQGKEFALKSREGEGEVNAKTTLHVKGSTMVKINC